MRNKARVSGAKLQRRRRPDLSVVVVVYNMPREAPRTLLSLSPRYQRYIDAADYEVIVVDNGSDPPVAPHEVESLADNFRLIRIDPAPLRRRTPLTGPLQKHRGSSSERLSTARVSSLPACCTLPAMERASTTRRWSSRSAGILATTTSAGRC
jgi:Glycosyl transferase family 2